LERSDPPGRAKNHVTTAAATSAKTAQALKSSATSCAGSLPRSGPFSEWKIDQSIREG
jgi:hypothetical protein